MSDNVNNNPIPRHLRPTTLTKREEQSMVKRQTTVLQSPKLRQLRRQHIVAAKVMGVTTETIGETFNLSNKAVRHELRQADKDGTIETLNERILSELVDPALEVYLHKMKTEKDAFVAKDVLKHLERLTNRKDEKAKSQEVQYSMEAYIKSKKQLPNGEFVDVEERIRGEAARQYLENGNLEPASPKGMSFMNDIVVEIKDE